MKACSVEGCARPHFAKTWCKIHYERHYRTRKTGKVGIARRPAGCSDEVWFWFTTEHKGECWGWTGARNNTGYGTLLWRGRTAVAHVVAYELAYGPVSQELDIDHLCRNRACVNPRHLEAVTHWENILRGESPSAVHARKTHCNKGHPLSGDNLRAERRSSGKVQRICLACYREYHTAYRAARRLSR